MMSARDDVLAAVRAALAQGPEGRPVVPRGYRSLRVAETGTALVDLFAERVAEYRATVTRCAADDVEHRLREMLDGMMVIVPDGLPWPVDGVRDAGQTATELDRLDAVVTTATVAVAVTGTIVLDHGPGQGRRALSLVPDLHVCVVLADQVVGTLPEAVALLDPARPQTWISGPSATSDIELQRVEGVHGPRTLLVLLVDAPATARS